MHALRRLISQIRLKPLANSRAPCITPQFAPRFNRPSPSSQSNRLGSSRYKARQAVRLFGRGQLHAMAAAPGEASDADIKLDRSAFMEVLKLKALRVPTSRCQELMKRFTGCATLCRRRRKPRSTVLMHLHPRLRG